GIRDLTVTGVQTCALPISALEPCRDQILDDLRLPVDDDRAAGQLAQRDVVALAVELQVDAAVDDPLAVEPVGQADFAQQLHVPLLDHARAYPVLAVLATAALEDHGLDACTLEQPAERQPGRAGADDAHLCP